jgi:hypothetical protein
MLSFPFLSNSAMSWVWCCTSTVKPNCQKYNPEHA